MERRDAAAAPSGRGAASGDTPAASAARSSFARGPVRFAVTDTWRDTIPHKVMLARGWREVPLDGGAWEFCYADVGWIHEFITYTETLKLGEGQYVNHYPNHVELTRKDLMAKHLKRCLRAAQKAGRADETASLSFFPPTYALPSEGALLLDAFRADESGVWIFKPVGRAQGKGIFIVSRLQQAEAWLREARAAAGGAAAAGEAPPETFVAQRYIERPLLVGGRKFDLRLYCAVTCFRPLTAWLYREGFCRFTARRYVGDAASLNDPFIHLTNHAVQKADATYDPAACDLKWPLPSLRAHLIAAYGETAADAALGAINAVVVNTLRCVAPSIIADRHCAELYGYDVMLDDTLKPWLIEVNASPSLSADTAADAALKSRLVDDFCSLLGLEGAWAPGGPPAGGPPSPCGGFDLVWARDAPVPCADFPTAASMLGATNDRAAPGFVALKHRIAAAHAARME